MAAAASSPATSGAGLVWYKVSDLRVHDHEPLFTAHQRHGAVVHVVCIDPRWFGTSPAGFPKTGFHRARFMSESIADLAGSLHGLGCSLVVRVARPEAVIPGIVEAAGVSAVYSHSEVCSEEQFADRQVRNALARLRKAPRFEQFWGNTMYHVDDLPFDPATACPDIFSQFRRTAETKCSIRPPLAAPKAWKRAPSGLLVAGGSAGGTRGVAAVPEAAGAHAGADGDGEGGAAASPLLPGPVSTAALVPVPVSAAAVANSGRVPSAWELGALLPAGFDLTALTSPAAGSDAASASASASGSAASGLGASEAARLVEESELRDARSAVHLVGGETAALGRLKQYFWDEDRLRVYKETRNGMVGSDYSSKLSPWLAFGCISPRFIAAEVSRYEAERVENKSTYWMLFELLWRDYFKFACLKWGTRVFLLHGPKDTVDKSRKWRRDDSAFKPWIAAATGYPFVDANMRELLQTGFMSNRGRQNVASYLTRDAEADWRIGAEWFESLLVDHDPCSNYGNWTYVAGVGADPREDRYFSIPKQARNYDGEGKFMRRWLPQLDPISLEQLINPQGMDSASREAVSYPAITCTLLLHRGGGQAGGPTGSGAGRGRGKRRDGNGRHKKHRVQHLG